MADIAWALFQDGVAVGGIRAEGAAAQRSLLVLVRLAEVLEGIREIDAEVEARFAQRIPGIDAIWTAIGRAVCENFRLAAQIANRGPFLWVRAVSRGNRTDAYGRGRRCKHL